MCVLSIARNAKDTRSCLWHFVCLGGRVDKRTRKKIAAYGSRKDASRGRIWPVFAPDGSSKKVHFATAAEAEIFEAREIWRREYDTSSGFQIGFRVVGYEVKRVDMDLRSSEVPVTLTREQIEAVSGCMGRSRTFGLREDLRAQLVRDGEIDSPEDFIERTGAKFRVYPHVGAAKGDILRAWPK